MSEINSIYFANKEYIISDFADIYLNRESIAEKVDTVVVTNIGEGKYGIDGYKNDKHVKLLPDGVYAQSVGYYYSYFLPAQGGRIYEIEY
ncbi:MAG: hypothetical protein CVU86_07355 [Firmicutes bacterium HGW-Firmicutes-11]|jgi:hypothetical protein|nr:MAG: hypothetical protein CVU86_07355 [Firmicutes bacterium HGW-Firmicutes-11]